MAPIEDFQMDIGDLAINFDEIASLSDMFPYFDSTKLMEDNMVGVDLPATPQLNNNNLLYNTNFQDLQPAHDQQQPVSPEMFLFPASPDAHLLSGANLLMQEDGDIFQPAPEIFFQPASPGHILQPASNDHFQPASPGNILRPVSPYLQPASPGHLIQPASPLTNLQPASPGYLQPASPLTNLQPASPGYLQPASPLTNLQPASPLTNLQPASPGYLQPASPLTNLQPASPGYLQPASPLTDLQSASPGCLQPASPLTNLQPASPGYLQPTSPLTNLQPASPMTNLQPASSGGLSFESSSYPEPDYLKPEPAQYTVVACPQLASSVEPAVPILSSYTLEVKKEAPVVEAETPAPKKRGRKPKYPKGTAPPRRSRAKKTKVYEMGPLPDTTLEKKRKNAINAKLHRDKQKNEREHLAHQLKIVTGERDGLLQLVEELKRSEASLRMRLAQGV